MLEQQLGMYCETLDPVELQKDGAQHSRAKHWLRLIGNSISMLLTRGTANNGPDRNASQASARSLTFGTERMTFDDGELSPHDLWTKEGSSHGRNAADSSIPEGQETPLSELTLAATSWLSMTTSLQPHLLDH